MDVAAFIAKWSASNASERANKDLFLTELCDVLGVARPQPSTKDPERDLYVFEKPIPMAKEGGKVTKKKADLYKHGLAAVGVVVAIDDENGRRWRNARQSVDA